jgi:hypothetical protein
MMVRSGFARARQLMGLVIVLGALLASGCTKLSMKPPQTPLALHAVAVQGHIPNHASRDSELSIGTAKVSEVTGTAIYPPGLTAYGRMPDQREWNYQYKVRDGQSALRGECLERVGETRYYGLGETTLDVSCRCFAATTQVAEVNLRGGEGKATLAPAHRFAVFGTRGAKQGGSSREILGYRFQSGQSVAAIDVTKASGAYYADNLSQDEQHAFTCLFAGVLLHRANR